MKNLQTTRRFFHVTVIPGSFNSSINRSHIDENVESLRSFSKSSDPSITASNSTEQSRHLIAELLRVDHAGKLGTMAIYSGQLAVMKRIYGSGKNTSSGFGISVTGLVPSMVQNLKRMQEQEKNHLDQMERLISLNNVQPTILAPICQLAGYALGE